MIRAVEDDDRQTDSLAQILGGLSLASSSGSSRSSSHHQVECLGESDVASISEGSNHQSQGVSSVFVGVEPEPVNNLDDAFVFGRTRLPGEPAELATRHIFVLIQRPLKLELGLPGEGLRLVDSSSHKVGHHVSRVHVNGNDVDDLHTFQHLKGLHNLANQLVDAGLDELVAFFHSRLSS